MIEGTTQIGPARGVAPNYEIQAGPGFLRFQLIDPKTDRLGFPDYLLSHLSPWHRTRLPELISLELAQSGLAGWWNRRDDNCWEIFLNGSDLGIAGSLLGRGFA